MKIILLIIPIALSLVACSAQKLSDGALGTTAVHQGMQEELRISDNLVLPHYLPKAAALSKEVIEIDEPKGKRVMYLAPRLVPYYIAVQTMGDFDSEDQSVASEATSFAEANIIRLRHKGINDTLLLNNAITYKFSDTEVVYQRVIRQDNNKVLHIYIFSLDHKLIFVQSWSDYVKKNEGYKKQFDTFVYRLIQNLESQVSTNDDV